MSPSSMIHQAILLVYQHFFCALIDGDSSFTQAKKPPCELNTLCVLTTAAISGTDVTSKLYLSKNDGKDQETIQSSATPDPGYHMGK